MAATNKAWGGQDVDLAKEKLSSLRTTSPARTEECRDLMWISGVEERSEAAGLLLDPGRVDQLFSFTD